MKRCTSDDEVIGGYGEGKLVHVYCGDGTLTEKSPRPWGFGKMHCKVLARNDDGNVSIIQVDGRTYLHGSILDQECTKADARIVELERIISQQFAMLSEISEAAGYGIGDTCSGYGIINRLREQGALGVESSTDQNF